MSTVLQTWDYGRSIRCYCNGCGASSIESIPPGLRHPPNKAIDDEDEVRAATGPLVTQLCAITAFAASRDMELRLLGLPFNKEYSFGVHLRDRRGNTISGESFPLLADAIASCHAEVEKVENNEAADLPTPPLNAKALSTINNYAQAVAARAAANSKP